MKKIGFYIVALFGWLAQVQGQGTGVPMRIELINQFAVGDKVYFDIVMRTTDGSTAFLNNVTLAITFDTLAFNNPQVQVDNGSARLANVEGRPITPLLSATILKDEANRRVLAVDFQGGAFQNEQSVRQFAPAIDGRLDVHNFGRFNISGYNGLVADPRLAVRTTAPTRSHLATVVTLWGPNAGGGTANVEVEPGGAFIYVKLGQFTAVPSGRSAELEWTTQNEVRMNSFEVERSIYPDRNFTRIGIMPSKGFPNTLSVYRMTDRDVYNPADPIPVYYYRVKYVAEDGTSAYSPVRGVNFNDGNQIDLQIWPNPTSDAVNLQLRNVVDEGILVRLLDRKGSEIGQKRFSPNEIIRFELGNVVPGVYFMEVITSKGKRTEKIVVWR